MITRLKIQKQLLKTAAAVEQVQTEIGNALQHMLDTEPYYTLFEVDGIVHPYYALQKMAGKTRTVVYRVFKSVLDWQVDGKSIRTQLDETRAIEIVNEGIGANTLIDELRALPGRANSAKVIAQQFIAALTSATLLEYESHPQTVRWHLRDFGIKNSRKNKIQTHERQLNKKCDALRKELIVLCKVLRQVNRNGSTIERALQAEETLMLLKNCDSGVIGLLLK